MGAQGLFRPCIEGIRAQLGQGLGPHELSLAVGVGAACAFFPVLGLATPLCVLAGMSLRLNQPVIQAVNVLTSPLYPLAVLGCFKLGAACLHGGPAVGCAFLLVRFGGCALLGWALASAAAVPLIYALCRAAAVLRSDRPMRRTCPTSLRPSAAKPRS